MRRWICCCCCCCCCCCWVPTIVFSLMIILSLLMVIDNVYLVQPKTITSSYWVWTRFSWFYLVFLGFLDLIRFSWVSPSFTQLSFFFKFLPNFGFSRSCWFLYGLAWFYFVLPSFSYFFSIWLRPTQFYQEFHSFTKLYLVFLPGFTKFFLVFLCLLGFTALDMVLLHGLVFIDFPKS